MAMSFWLIIQPAWSSAIHRSSSLGWFKKKKSNLVMLLPYAKSFMASYCFHNKMQVSCSSIWTCDVSFFLQHQLWPLTYTPAMFNQLKFPPWCYVSCQLGLHLFDHSFIQQIFSQHLLYVRHCSRYWTFNSGPNTDISLFLGWAHALVMWNR